MTPDVPTARGAQSSNSSISVAEPLVRTACCTCMPEGKVQGDVCGGRSGARNGGEAEESTVCTARTVFTARTVCTARTLLLHVPFVLHVLDWGEGASPANLTHLPGTQC